MRKPRPYPTEITGDAWAVGAPYLIVIATQSPQRQYDLRVMFNALRWIVRAGAPWRVLPNDFPPWEAVYQQTQRWVHAGCFDAIGTD